MKNEDLAGFQCPSGSGVGGPFWRRYGGLEVWIRVILQGGDRADRAGA